MGQGARLGEHTMSGSHKAGPSLIPDIEAFEERAAIAEYDGVLIRLQAENLDARSQGFRSAWEYWQWLKAYVANRGLH